MREVCGCDPDVLDKSTNDEPTLESGELMIVLSVKYVETLEA